MRPDPDPVAHSPGGHVETWLDAFRTGELEGPERHRVERHLERCADCARRLAELEVFAREVSQAFSAGAALGAAAEPDWEVQRRAILARTTGPRPERPSGAWLRYAPQAAVAVLALVVLGVLARQGVRGPADAGQRLEERSGAAGEEGSGRSEAEPGRANEAPVGQSAAEGWAGELDSGALPPGPAQGEPGTPEGFVAPPADEGAAAQGRDVPGAVGVEARPSPVGLAPGAPRGARKAAPAALESDAAEDDERAVTEDRAALRAAPKGADTGAAEEKARDAAPAGGPPMDDLQRLDLYGRRALASGDSLAAAHALAFWRDSVAARTDLDPVRKRAAAALVDTLAAREAARRAGGGGME